MSREDRDSEMVFDREGADQEDRGDAHDIADVYALDAGQREEKVERSSCGACEGVYLLAEDEGHFVYADVAQDASEHCRDDAESD